MTKIAQVLTTSAVTPDLVNEFFHQSQGVDSPVDAAIIKKAGDLCQVNWLGLYCMAIIETGWFTSKIFKNNRNMFGLGAVDSDPERSASVFFDYKEAALAGAQHLAVYSGVPDFKNLPVGRFVLERTAKIRDWGYFGLVKEFKDLGGKTDDNKVKWASNPEHGKQIEGLYSQILSYCIDNYQPPQKPETPEPPKEEPPKKELPKGVIVAVLKILVSIVGKFFPWLGWLTVILYALIDLLSK